MNELDIPIDIHVQKLQDWLISRRIVDKNWHRYVKDIRKQQSLALQDMPAAHEDLVKLLSGSHINYFHCKQIIDILKKTEKDSKSIFGYGSKRMQDWQQVIKMYEKDNIYLGEVAQILTRNVSYEIPSVRKQIAQLDKFSEEATKKCQDSVKSESILKSEYKIACQQLGINGDKIKLELAEKLKELPDLQLQVAQKIPDLKRSVELYSSFSGNKHCLPALHHIIKYGNTTVYEYKYSEVPVKIEEPPLAIKIDDDETYNEINIGYEQHIDFGGEEVDFGDAAMPSEIILEGGEINWGEEEAAEDQLEIDSNISLAESGIVVEETGISAGVARESEAFTILDSPQYHDTILDELLELEAFLKMRLYELTANDKVHVISMSLLDGFTDHDAKTIVTMIGIVDTIVTSLTASLIQQLYQIKHSPKYVDILTNKLRQKLRAIEKLQVTQKVLQEKSVELKQQSLDLRPTLTKLIDQTKVLQRHIEEDISSRYKNRKVNLMGSNL